MSKYDIGIVGYWYATNYGSIITYYALNLTLNKMGYTTVLIDRPEKDSDPEGEDVISRFFFKEHCNISESVKWEEMDLLNSLCDVFVVGSDQVWTKSAIRYMGYMFFLSFVSNDKKKIAYASSFGSESFFNINTEQEKKVKECLHDFDRISVRETSGVKMVKERFGINVDRTLDPVFLITLDDYIRIGNESNINTEGKYALAYILDPTPDKERGIKKISEKLGVDIKIILDGRKGTFSSNRSRFEIYSDDKILRDINEADWIKLFRDSQYVFTDSHHGLAMAIIFKKQYICYANYSRGYERFTSLLSLLNMMERMVDSNEQITEELIGMEIDYSRVDDIIDEERKKSLEWLRNAVTKPKNELPSICLPPNVTIELKREACMGCGACVSTCAANALSLQANELGYYCPMVDYTKCISCGKCIEICPAIKLPKNQNSDKPKLFEIIVADEKILYNSSSGGAFPTLARKVFEMHGVVVGAAWRNDFSVEHIIINDEKELYKLQKSKYLQSYLGDIFRKIKEKLEGGIFVLFSGCPCQAAGLKSYLQKEYDNLIIVDLLCSNTPSAMFFQKYLADDFTEPLKKYEFRHKRQGGKAECDCISVTTATGVTEVRRGGKQDNYQRVYHNHVMCAPHCEKCNYQTVPRFGDLTIGDFWGISGKDKTIDTSKGVSAVLCNNEKGRKFLDSIPQEVYSIKKQVPLEWLGENGYAINGSHNYCSPKRNDFYKAITTMSFNEAIVYALKPNHGEKPERGLFDFCAKENHFTFNPSIWNEDYINGSIVLTTRESNPRVGNYAVMPIHSIIKAGKAYILKIRFKLSTNAPIYNFHLKSAGELLIQVIYSHKVESTDSVKWVEVSHEFVADSNVYDEFMIGASQLSGENRWLVIDYIKIFEKI